MRRALARPNRKPMCPRTSAISSTRPANGRFPVSITGISSSRAAAINCRSSAEPVGRPSRSSAAGASTPFHRAERRPVHGQPRRGSREHRRRTSSASQSAPRSQPSRRRADAGALVRYVGICAAGAFTFGNAPRNSVLGPGYANVDFALAKTWRSPGLELEFRWEISTCEPGQLRPPNRIFGNPNFGRIFSARIRARCSSAYRLAF